MVYVLLKREKKKIVLKVVSNRLNSDEIEALNFSVGLVVCYCSLI